MTVGVVGIFRNKKRFCLLSHCSIDPAEFASNSSGLNRTLRHKDSTKISKAGCLISSRDDPQVEDIRFELETPQPNRAIFQDSGTQLKIEQFFKTLEDLIRSLLPELIFGAELAHFKI
jgi:hypothetical protein